MNFLITFCMFLTCWQGTIILFRALAKQRIVWWSLGLFASGLTGVITYFMGLWG